VQVTREVRWDVNGVAWRMAVDEAQVRLWREEETLAFPASELPLLGKALRSLARGGPARLGLPWNADDDAALGQRFDAGETVAELARAFERSPGAVTARLVRLGRLEDRGQRRWPG
jgi:hypothetical protein